MVNYPSQVNGRILSGKVVATALPTAGANLLAASVKNNTDYPTIAEVYVCISIAGKFTLIRTPSGGSAQNEILNSDISLVAGALYGFAFLMDAGDTVNFKYSTDGGTIHSLYIVDVMEG